MTRWRTISGVLLKTNVTAAAFPFLLTGNISLQALHLAVWRFDPHKCVCTGLAAEKVNRELYLLLDESDTFKKQYLDTNEVLIVTILTCHKLSNPLSWWNLYL